MPQLRGWESSCSSTTGCAPTLTAAPLSLYLNRGGSASQDRFSITPDGVSCLRLCERSSISLKPRLSQSLLGPRDAGGRAQADSSGRHRFPFRGIRRKPLMSAAQPPRASGGQPSGKTQKGADRPCSEG